jgi:hypothetical protein
MGMRAFIMSHWHEEEVEVEIQLKLKFKWVKLTSLSTVCTSNSRGACASCEMDKPHHATHKKD